MEKIFTAKTLEEAKALAVAFFGEQGVDEAEIDFEILEQPKKSLFGGLKGEFKINAAAPDKSAAPAVPAPDAVPAPKAETAASVLSDEEKKAAGNAKVEKAVAYLTKVLTALGAENFRIDVIDREEIKILDIVGDKLGIVIGRRGETLDSLQYLAILAGNRNGESYCRISVDCNGYREKRRETLESLAERTARKVLKQGRRVTLEPMNPYERRIIHSKVAEIEGVFSNSIGEEPFRKVVISANVPRRSTAPRDDRQGGNRDNRGRDDRRRGGNPNAGKSYKQSSGFSTSFEREYKREPSKPIEYSQETIDLEKDDTLFGKIDL